MDYVILEYWNSKDLGGILYQKGFKNKLYLDADIGEPEYGIIEEGEEDGENNFLPYYQRYCKIYKTVILANEYMLDALYLVRLHDNIYITFKTGERFNIYDVQISHTWENDGYVARLEITFFVNYFTKVASNENIKLKDKKIIDKKTMIIEIEPAKMLPLNPNPARPMIRPIYGGKVSQVVSPESPFITDPIDNGVKKGDAYIITEDGKVDKIVIFDPSKSNNGTFWVDTRTADGDKVEDLEGRELQFYNGAAEYYNEITSLTSEVVGLATNITIKGTGAFGSYTTVYYRIKGSGLDYAAFGTAQEASFRTRGITAEVVAGNTYEFYFNSFTHTDDFGNSDVSEIIV